MSPRSYQVRTFGCQMNVHDSERIAGMLDAAGYVPAATDATPDVVVFNTCAVRENADNRLYGNLGQMYPAKKQHPGMQIAVGGCLAQKDRATITERAPWVDVVFGTHNLHRLPVLLERARHNAAAEVEIVEALEVFPSALPSRRSTHHSAWVSISVGCDNTCTFCIVPSLRGRETDRRPGDVLAEVEALVADGVIEITLLGQNVNSYGRSLGDPGAFAKLLHACGTIEGLERVRFTSPHPRDFTDDVIEAMATAPNVCPQLHMPLQSGSDAVLRRMRRSYRQERFLGILERVRAAMPHAAITTDIIVGFPGETEADFADTLHVVRQARFAGAFTFQYSPRAGTPAATMDGQVDPAVVRDRYERLVAVQDEVSWVGNRALVGQPVEVLVVEGEGRKDAATGRRSGRARDGRLVHLGAPSATLIRPGDVVRTAVTRGAPHHLVADGPLLAHRRTRAGDLWEAERERPAAAAAAGAPTLLGMPALRR
ncbi:tRNA (N6-isopentenyl adenosine(37)-C2)-methylthiotransferase MiaB [Frankia sp. CiP1_Cm_nod2]|uniref:tRNA (N6-isopentenyl adenosine(37)-C2)-methylthiotransferase MiaB n=2 Tax=unclassified Frankia TaxID=2632575 RepID=UPI004043A64E